MDDRVEIFVPHKKTICITCPKCKLEKTIKSKDVPFKSYRFIDSLCKRCFFDFKVIFNFRKYYRKPTKLIGFIFSYLNAQDPLTEVIVNDVSLNGVGFISPTQIISKNSVLTIRFYLDDLFELEIEREINIVSNRKSYYGAKFFDKNIFSPLLYNYITQE